MCCSGHNLNVDSVITGVGVCFHLLVSRLVYIQWGRTFGLPKKTKPRLRLRLNVAMVDSIMELLAGKGPSSSGGRWEYNVLAILVIVIPVGCFRIHKEERSRSDAAERL